MKSKFSRKGMVKNNMKKRIISVVLVLTLMMCSSLYVHGSTDSLIIQYYDTETTTDGMVSVRLYLTVNDSTSTIIGCSLDSYWWIPGCYGIVVSNPVIMQGGAYVLVNVHFYDPYGYYVNQNLIYYPI